MASWQWWTLAVCQLKEIVVHTGVQMILELVRPFSAAKLKQYVLFLFPDNLIWILVIEVYGKWSKSWQLIHLSGTTWLVGAEVD